MPLPVRSAVTPPISKRQHALDIPETTYHPETVRPRQTLQPTIPQPFEFPGDYFSQRSKEQFQRLLSQQGERENQLRIHKAKQVPKFFQKPLAHAEDSTDDDQDANVTYGMFMNSAKRAKERKAFDEYMRRKEELTREMELREEEERNNREKQEVQELRKQMVYKAMEYKPVQPFLPVRAEPKYTVPKTFNFTMFKSPCK
ncbi:hypothetical protein SS50377_22753 [Spironucleus salmonicida]|uniref:TPX2 C-terminal domain-containing protein n=1 Tax=Spironucleus salmonicida TaxID=348837 RepID=V6LW97_9EUKA|nr:hypothetical protein SS50377_22753 [Spironucleus salmonicida]|eukprot:EST48902.1 Hypothetical protein SS50377_10874 [Spironucleus salmonicida]